MDEKNTPTPEDFDPIITLTDADGNDVEYEFLDVVEYNGHEYAVVLPVEDEDGLVVILRIEPVEDDPEQEQLQAIIEMAVSEMGADLSIHDLRIIKKAKQPLISFDLTAPYDTALDLHALENCIFSRLPPAWKNYKLSIQVDRE